MFETETETIAFQSHSNTNDYLVVPCVSMDTNPAKYYKVNHRKYLYLAKLAKEVFRIPSSSWRGCSALQEQFSHQRGVDWAIIDLKGWCLLEAIMYYNYNSVWHMMIVWTISKQQRLPNTS